MKMKLIAIGKTDPDYIEKGVTLYRERIVHYIPFEIVYINDLKRTNSFSPQEIKTKEGDLLLSRIGPNDHVVLLDDKGKEFSSLEFSGFINKKNLSLKSLTFIIGGAYGFSEDVYRRANEKLSLSKLTFSHQMVRLIFLEQLYRAMTILRNEKYHHE